MTTTALHFSSRIEPRYLVLIALGGVLAFAVLYPVVLLAINTFVITRPFQETQYGLDAWRFVLTDRGITTALVNTIRVMVVQQAISFPIAIGLTWLITRTNLPGARTLEFMFWLAFFLPTLPIVQGWILVFHPNVGLANRLVEILPWVDKGRFNIFSFWGIIWAHLFTSSIAIKVMILAPAFRNLDSALEEASRVSGSGPIRTITHVVVPAIMPSLVVMMMLSIMRSFQQMEIELVLGMRWGFFNFGTKVFDLTRFEPAMFGAASALSFSVLLILVPLIWYQRHISTRRHYTTLTSKYRSSPLHLRRWKYPAFLLVLTFALLPTLVPGSFLLLGTFMKLYGIFDVPAGAFTLRWWDLILGDPVFLRAVRNTMVLALGAATLSAVFFGLVAYMIVRGPATLRRWLDYLVWVPNTLPGIVMALAWLWVFLRTPGLSGIYGTILGLIIVSGITGLTLGVQILKANLLQLGREMEEAAYVSGQGWLGTIRKIVVPLMMPALIVVWVINFVQAASDAIMPAMLASSQSRPLALLQLEYVLGRQSEAASVVGVFIVLIATVTALVVRLWGLRIGLRA